MHPASRVHQGFIRRGLAALTATVLVAVGALITVPAARADDTPTPSSPAPLLQRTPDHVTSDDLPTVQINDGYVWAQTTIGTTVYAVGKFANVRPAGAAVNTNLTPRSNVLAYDITTGNLITAFAPTVNGVVKSVTASPDGKRIYIGGSFDTVNGQPRWNFAALDATTGQLVPGFNSSIGGTGVYAMTATSSGVYVGGLFTQANGTTRQNLAAFDPSTGALLAWAPITDRQVDAMVMEPQTGKVVIGGRFYSTNGQVQRGLANLDPVTGAINTAWQAPNVVQNGWNTGSDAGSAGIFGLAADASGVYGTGWVYANAAVGNLEGVFAADAGSGDIRWISDCHGDHYGVYSTGSVVYATDHTHQCETVSLWPDSNPRAYRYAESYTTYANGTLTRSSSAGSTYKDWSGTPSPSAYDWFPDFTVGTTSGLGQAGLSVTGAAGYISIGGEFGTVNNLSQQGLTRFSTAPPGGAKQGPRVQTSSWTPQAISVTSGTARISIPANWDRDDLNLTYTLRRQGSSTPVATQTVASTWWNQPTVTLNDSGLTPGSSQTYTVTATDADGNSRASSPVTVTIASSSTSPYASTVLQDNPSLYYRLGGTAVDWAGANNPVYGANVTTVTPGGIADQGSAASRFDGTNKGIVSSSKTASTASSLSEETWFKTTTTEGGMLIGYGDSQTGSSSNHDRHVYMTNAGKIVFGVYPGSAQTITSPQSYNDGNWHHVVSTLGSDGMKLYLDGTLVASNASVTTAQPFTGYWRIAGDNVGGWPNAPTSNYFSGSMNDVAIYSSALTPQQVAQHYSIGKGLTPPTAAFTTTSADLKASFDASGSTAMNGHSITSYAWNFGDSSAAGTGKTATHTYASAGTYPVTLTVTDDSGMTSSVTNSVTVLAPNDPPTASFTSTASGLTASVDGTASSDPDGSLVGYSWDWGDGTAAGTGMTMAHTYNEPGTYTITLTVTDNRGGTATKTRDVTVTHAAPTASFTAVADGLGVSADGSGSTASDGATLTYAWDWGDDSTDGSGRTATHTYAAAGTYSIKLTVTDSMGSTATKTQQVTVTAVTYAASDDFSRTVPSGWGAADIGGTWSALYGPAADGSVDGSRGNITLSGGKTRNMALAGLSVRDSEASVQFSLSSPPSQGSSYVGIASRQSASSNYTARVWMNGDGSVWLLAQQSGTDLKVMKMPGLTWTNGEVFHLKTKVSGTSPTTIQAKVWKDGSPEPTDWQLTTTDSTAALQAAGYTSVQFARAASATTSSTASFDTFRVVDLSPPPAATAPTASFTAQTTDLKTTVDASASTAQDGATISTYTWDWGDNSTAGTGKTTNHTYTQAGTYTVKLTVKDSNGLTGTTTKTITATDPPAATAPTASFTAQTTDLKTTVDASASTAQDGATISTYTWDWGDNSTAGTGKTTNHTYTQAGTYTVKLTVKDSNGLTGTTTKTITATDGPPDLSSYLAADGFGRTVATGWGASDKGGAWSTLYGGASAASVASGSGKLEIPTGKVRFQALNGVSVQDVLLEANVSAADAPATGQSYVGFFARQNASGDNYQVRVWLRSDGSVWLVTQHGNDVLNTYAVPGVTWASGDSFTVKAQVSGSGTTTITAKLWKAGSTEPSAWQITSTDTTAALQTPGTIGVSASRSSSATTTGTYNFSRFRATSLA
ncbi:PKD domain-containing protein [Brachybacterium huguangmaarense]|uniref:PKD domain-containing protein n=1 Tax=Brachybacterium huguangmaarense TaxID=1652028 RepID=A0ABY6G4N3_9MICO|nr:PKD domain-containing protein [Brachybacterium huguangmaarense]UYG18186.1 PKD domain-containing protein [Brachybacterium huguangmaarense]